MHPSINLPPIHYCKDWTTDAHSLNPSFETSAKAIYTLCRSRCNSTPGMPLPLLLPGACRTSVKKIHTYTTKPKPWNISKSQYYSRACFLASRLLSPDDPLVTATTLNSGYNPTTQSATNNLPNPISNLEVHELRSQLTVRVREVGDNTENGISLTYNGDSTSKYEVLHIHQNGYW